MNRLQSLEFWCPFFCLLTLVTAHQTDLVNEEWMPLSVAVVIVVSAVVAVTLIVLLIQCGGCVGMEVSSESHPASGGKAGHAYPTVVTDANTQVLLSSHTLPGDDPYTPGSGGQGLPYSMTPGIPSAAGFTGYQSSTPQPTPSAPGWGQTGVGQTYQSPGPGVHRSAVNNEPPPPSYNDTIRGSDALW
ncbi:uncharacterized protein LOC111106291 [Crassostrea virginica]